MTSKDVSAMAAAYNPTFGRTGNGRSIPRYGTRRQPQFIQTKLDSIGTMFLAGVHMYKVPALGDVNDDAMARLNEAGYQANCRWVPYLGPLGGGHNVCDVAGDDRGEEFGAELLARPGGVDIYREETREGAYNSMQTLCAENQKIRASMGLPPVDCITGKVIGPTPPPVTPPPPVRAVEPTIIAPPVYVLPPAPTHPTDVSPPGWWTYGGGQGTQTLTPMQQQELQRQQTQQQVLFTATTPQTTTTTTTTSNSNGSNSNATNEQEIKLADVVSAPFAQILPAAVADKMGQLAEIPLWAIGAAAGAAWLVLKKR